MSDTAQQEEVNEDYDWRLINDEVCEKVDYFDLGLDGSMIWMPTNQEDLDLLIDSIDYGDMLLVYLDAPDLIEKGQVVKVDESVIYQVKKTKPMTWYVPVDIGVPGLHKLDSRMRWKMPKVPFTIMDKMDTFFREVHRRYNTESIVVLAYNFDDDELEAEERWQVIAPKQQNSAGHCNYDHADADSKLWDGYTIVGSAHSHPNMDAYASETDHKDQKDFPGLHITFAWKHSGVTNYYAEISASGEFFVIPIESVAEVSPVVEDEEIEEWISDVAKSTPAPTTTTNQSYWNKHQGSSTTTHGRSTTSKVETLPNGPLGGKTLIKNFPGSLLKDMRNAYGVIHQLLPSAIKSTPRPQCPACNINIIETDAARGHCGMCGALLVVAERGVTTVTLIKTYLQAMRDILEDKVDFPAYSAEELENVKEKAAISIFLVKVAIEDSDLVVGKPKPASSDHTPLFSKPGTPAIATTAFGDVFSSAEIDVVFNSYQAQIEKAISDPK